MSPLFFILNIADITITLIYNVEHLVINDEPMIKFWGSSYLNNTILQVTY